jgi:hypothetical protein
MLHLQRQICARLDGIPGVCSVHAISPLTQSACKERLPAIFVTFDGYRVDNAKSADGVVLAVRWLVVLAISSESSTLTRDEAGIVERIIGRLYRWKGSGALAMQPLGAPQPSYDNGRLLICLPFEADMVVTKED